MVAQLVLRFRLEIDGRLAQLVNKLWILEFTRSNQDTGRANFVFDHEKDLRENLVLCMV